MFGSCLLLTAQSQKGKEFSCSFGGSSESSAVGFSSGKQLWGFLFPFIFFFMLFDTWNHFGLNQKLLRKKKRDVSTRESMVWFLLTFWPLNFLKAIWFFTFYITLYRGIVVMCYNPFRGKFIPMNWVPSSSSVLLEIPVLINACYILINR